MTPPVRKFALTAHVTSAVGWLGAVASFLTLALAGLASRDADLVRAAYVATDTITWWVIVPLAFAALATGLIMSLGTQWGLFPHYWVLVKFMLTMLATVLLLLHTRPIGALASVARESRLWSNDVRQLQMQLVGDASAALFVLLVNVTLSVYKPYGLTAYGRRRQGEPRQIVDESIGDAQRAPRWIQALAIAIAALIVGFVIVHLAGRGLGSLHH
jgi:hypothetical protein